MNRRTERLADLLPAVVADLAARHTTNGAAMTDIATTLTITALLEAWERRYVESLNAILAAYDDGSADAHRWRGHAEAYRQVCERLRREFGMEPARYTSAEWRRDHGVYTDEDIASFRRVARGGAA